MPQLKILERLDLIGMSLIALLGIVLVFLLDTGSVAEWIAGHKHTKIDEIVFTAVALLLVGWLFSARKWWNLSRLVTRYEESPQPVRFPELNRMRAAQRRDLFGLAIALLSSFVVVLFSDTGSIAQWIAEHKDTRIDEMIVTGVILVIGLLFLSIRRWTELTDQVVRYEELHRKTTRLNREVILLGELSESLQSCLSINEAYKLITATGEVLFPGSSGAVCVIANSRDVVEIVATWGGVVFSDRDFEPKDCWALRRGRLHRFRSDRASFACTHLAESRSPGSMCVPMMAHGEALGLLHIDTKSSPESHPLAIGSDPFTDEERLARTLAEQSALALANLKMRDVLKMQSTRDSLTGLFNRRYMEESLDRELKRAVRKGSPLAVLMIDVDHFKGFNDTFGHEAGDAVLRCLATLLKTQFREEDIVCRYGGEEFTVILPEASTDVARQRSSALCEASKQMLVQHRGQPLRSISLSIGVAVFGEHGTSADSLLRASDAALYLAKTQGRDQVVVADPLEQKNNSSPAEQVFVNEREG
jgi:diguanylate cyclase (GGDEF)-like protein